MFDHEILYLRERHLLRRPFIVYPPVGARVWVEGIEAVLLCSNDYLGLAARPELREAAIAAMERYGFGSGASRLVSGTSPLHAQLEQRIADFKGTEAAILFNSGYAANTGVIPAIAGEGDAILSDSLNHASIIDGCRLSRAQVHIYRHRDVNHAEDILKKCNHCRRRLIVTDSVFSMDGDIAPLIELAYLAEKYDAMLMVDDAHGTGVLGGNGRGTVEHLGLSYNRLIQMGTLGKALGTFGAYVAGPADLITYLMSSVRSFIFSTALPPLVCAASIAAIDIVKNEPQIRSHLWGLRERFVQGLAKLGISTGASETQIIPIIIGSSDNALKAANELIVLGVFAPAIRPPSVPEGSSRIRATITASLSDRDIDIAVEAFGILKQKGYLDDQG